MNFEKTIQEFAEQIKDEMYRELLAAMRKNEEDAATMFMEADYMDGLDDSMNILDKVFGRDRADY